MADSSTRTLECARCETTYTVKRRPGSYPKHCSDTCRKADRADYLEARKNNGYRTPHISRMCEVCGTEIPVGTRADSVTCGDTCRDERANNLRKSRNRATRGTKLPTSCSWCGGAMPKNGHALSKFCGDECRHSFAVDRSLRNYRANRARMRETHSEWKKRNPDYWKTWGIQNRDKTYRSKARRRARERNAYVLDVNNADIFKRDNGLCYSCGEPIEVDSFHIDHLVPLALGGTHEPNNVAASCARCNLSKGPRMTELAIQKRGQNMMDFLREALQ